MMGALVKSFAGCRSRDGGKTRTGRRCSPFIGVDPVVSYQVRSSCEPFTALWLRAHKVFGLGVA